MGAPPLPPDLSGMGMPAGPPPDPSMMGMDPSMGQAPPPPDGSQDLAMVIADAIKSFQATQAQGAVMHPVVASLLAPPPSDPMRGMAGGAFAPAPPMGDPSAPAGY